MPCGWVTGQRLRMKLELGVQAENEAENEVGTWHSS